MSVFMINGGKSLYGKYKVQGAKNSVLPLIAAAYLCDGQCVLHNCPNLSDVTASLKILSCLGCKHKREGTTLIIEPTSFVKSSVPECLMREMRSSIVFMGAVSAKTGKAILGLPGGCELGPRPIDLHIDALKKLGAVIEFDGGRLVCSMPDGVVGNEIFLKFPSVGATENIILAAVISKGQTIIKNAAREPEIVDLQQFLNMAGANINGAGTDTVVINGVKSLQGVEYSVMPDRIVAATCMSAVASCGGKICLEGAVREHLIPISTVLEDCGCDIQFNSEGMVVTVASRIKSFDTVTTQPYPGFPTDAGPLLVAAVSTAKGTGVFIENIFDSRFNYIDELTRLGADIKTVGKIAVINGVKSLYAASISACDLRGGAAMAIASMSANGVSYVSNVEFIDRGYDSFESIFGLLGADVTRY